VSQAKSDPNSTIDKKLQRQDRNQIIKQRLAQINQKPLNIKRKDSLDDEEGGQQDLYLEEEDQEEGYNQEEEKESPVLDPKSIEAVKAAYTKKVRSRSSVRKLFFFNLIFNR
jgi:hypothetical protein